MEQFKQRARKLRAAQTSAEARLWRPLRNRRLAHWKFRRQHPIDRYIVLDVYENMDGVLEMIDRTLHPR
jgi:very-short-patch-repair endonuclease